MEEIDPIELSSGEHSLNQTAGAWGGAGMPGIHRGVNLCNNDVAIEKKARPQSTVNTASSFLGRWPQVLPKHSMTFHFIGLVFKTSYKLS